MTMTNTLNTNEPAYIAGLNSRTLGGTKKGYAIPIISIIIPIIVNNFNNSLKILKT
jgi:hypothetical protein